MAFVVRDTGPGIPEHQRGRIWERLYRGEAGEKERGLGLGLSLVRAVVEAHGGRAEVKSAPGQGSTFTLIVSYLNAWTTVTSSPLTKMPQPTSV